MIDELKLLDTAIKALMALRDKNSDDGDYQEYLAEHIERLERKQAEKILEYEKQKEDRQNIESYPVPIYSDGDDADFDDEDSYPSKRSEYLDKQMWDDDEFLPDDDF